MLSETTRIALNAYKKIGEKKEEASISSPGCWSFQLTSPASTSTATSSTSTAPARTVAGAVAAVVAVASAITGARGIGTVAGGASAPGIERGIIGWEECVGVRHGICQASCGGKRHLVQEAVFEHPLRGACSGSLLLLRFLDCSRGVNEVT